MKRVVLCLLFVASFATVSQAGVANMLDNPGFESGTTDGWTPRACSIEVVTDPVNSGSYSGLASGRNATWQGIQQDITSDMVDGATYVMSAYVRTSAAEDSDIRISVEQRIDGQTSWVWVAPGTANNSAWTYLEGEFTLNLNGGTLNALAMYIEGPAAGVDIYADDCTVIPEPTTIALLGLGALGLLRRRKS